MPIFRKHFDLIVILFCTAIVTILGVLYLGLKGFSMDELDTMFITSSWTTMLHFITYSEGNMWLYFCLLYFWKFLGHSEFFVRLLSVLFASATVPFAYLIGKKLFTSRVAAVSSVLLSINVFLISNAQNARAYTMLLFFTTLSSYFFMNYVLKGAKKYLFLATIANVLAMYCHLYAIFVIGAQLLSLLLVDWNKLWKEVVLNVVLFGILLLPLFLAPSMHSGQVNWIAKPDIKNLIGTYLILSNDYPAIGGIYLLLIAGYFIDLFKRRPHLKLTLETWKYGFIFLWIVFPIVSSFIFSIFVKPLYISAYFFICLVPFTLFIALCITQIKQKWLQVGLIIVIVILSFIRLYGWYMGSKRIGLVIRNYNEDFKGTASFLSMHTTSSDAIIFLPSSVQDKVNFYITQQNYSALSGEITLQPDYVSTASFNFTIDKTKLASLPYTYSHIWYVLETVTDSRVDADNAIITSNLLQHYKVTNIDKLEAMTIFEYTKVK